MTKVGTTGTVVQPVVLKDLDLTEKDPGSIRLAPPPSLSPYDPLRDRELMRGRLAGGLTIILAFLVVVSFGLLANHLASGSEIKDLLGVLFGPIVALVGSVTGFYFGAQTVPDRSSDPVKEGTGTRGEPPQPPAVGDPNKPGPVGEEEDDEIVDGRKNGGAPSNAAGQAEPKPPIVGNGQGEPGAEKGDESKETEPKK